MRCAYCSQPVPPFETRLRHQKPIVNFWGHHVWATVRCPVCPEYTQPVGGSGVRTGRAWAVGETLQILVTCDSPCGRYVSALTEHGGWVNIWARWNVRARKNIGCQFCTLTFTERDDSRMAGASQISEEPSRPSNAPTSRWSRTSRRHLLEQGTDLASPT